MGRVETLAIAPRWMAEQWLSLFVCAGSLSLEVPLCAGQDYDFGFFGALTIEMVPIDLRGGGYRKLYNLSVDLIESPDQFQWFRPPCLHKDV